MGQMEHPSKTTSRIFEGPLLGRSKIVHFIGSKVLKNLNTFMAYSRLAFAREISQLLVGHVQ